MQCKTILLVGFDFVHKPLSQMLPPKGCYSLWKQVKVLYRLSRLIYKLDRLYSLIIMLHVYLGRRLGAVLLTYNMDSEY
jgi:hypothetical protein